MKFRYEIFSDATVARQGFRKGLFDVYIEDDVRYWHTALQPSREDEILIKRDTRQVNRWIVTGIESCHRASLCNRINKDLPSLESATPSANNPYNPDCSSADRTSNLSIVLSSPAAFVTPKPHAPEKLRFGMVVDILSTPPLGALGFT